MHRQIIFLLHNGQPCHAMPCGIGCVRFTAYIDVAIHTVYDCLCGSKVVCAMIRRPEGGGVIGTVDE